MKKIKRIVRLLRDEFWRAKQRYPVYLRTLEIDECAILLESEHGRKLDGNIFYLLRELAKNEDYQCYRIYLSSLGRNMRRFKRFLENHGITRVKVVMLASDEYFRLLASAKYLANDTSFGPYFVKREGQVYMNTWHGTPIKCLGRKDVAELHRLGNIQRNFALADYLVCQNEYTRDILVRDYMLKNLTPCKILLSGYPRNDIFFNAKVRKRVKMEMSLGEKRVFAYLPTYRGSLSNERSSRYSAYLAYHLYEIDRTLTDNEIMFVKLHPLARESVNFAEYKRVRSFPEKYELYEFLTAADMLISDYSSVIFDFVLTGRKIILFTHDEDEYITERGTYMKPSALPFAVAKSVDALIKEMRSDNMPSTEAFVRKFCRYDGKNASRAVARALLFDEGRFEKIEDNGKENLIIYAGNLAKNGITASLLSLLCKLDLEKRNYFIAFRSEAVSGNLDVIRSLPNEVGYISFSGDINLSLQDRLVR